MLVILSPQKAYFCVGQTLNQLHYTFAHYSVSCIFHVSGLPEVLQFTGRVLPVD